MSFRLLHGNIEQPDVASDRLKTIATIAQAADVFTLNEAKKDHTPVKGLLLFSEFIGVEGENAVVWRTAKFDLLETFSEKVMQGGVHDGRRRGPSRDVTGVVVREKATQRTFIIGTHHAIPKSDTDHPERRPLQVQGFRATGAAIRRMQAKYPGAAVVLTGDLNDTGKVVFGFGEVEVAAPKTYPAHKPRLRYDRILKAGPGLVVDDVETLRTKADHLAVSVRVTATPALPPILEPPTPKPPVEIPVPPAQSSVAKLTAIAKKYVGFREGRNNTNPFAGKVGFANNQAWCASFVCAVFKEAGLLSLITTPSPGVDQLAAGFKRAKRWSEYPALGAVVCFGKASDLNHTGIVVAYNADTITTVEGNTNDDGGREGNGVYLKTRQRRSANVVGYGYPAFVEGITSADPAWQKKPAAPKPPASKPPTLTGFKPTIDGVDISHWQTGALDWAAAKKAGVQFVYHKATEDLDYRDPRYPGRRTEAAKAGLPFGAYHFARPKLGGGTMQARFFLAYAKPKPGDLRPVLDLEDKAGLTDEQLTRWVEAFVAEVKAQTGKTPVLYTNFALTRDVGCYLWVARYNNANALPKTPRPWSSWHLWQFTNGVAGRPNTVPGLGHVDANTFAPGFTVDRIIL